VVAPPIRARSTSVEDLLKAPSGGADRSAVLRFLREFDVQVQELAGQVEVAVVGEVDLHTAGRLRDSLLEVAEQGHRQVVVDLGGVSFIDSSGLAALVTGLKRQREEGGSLTLRSPQPGVQRVLDITGLSHVFAISA
jgi:anti-sigma B factor antagonist